MSDPVVGGWWRYPRAPGYLYRYQGRTSDGGYRFAKFHESDVTSEMSVIDIYNLDSMEQVASLANDEGDRDDP